MKTVSRARMLGQIVQGVALGLLVFIAILELATHASETGVFRYQGF